MSRIVPRRRGPARARRRPGSTVLIVAVKLSRVRDMASTAALEEATSASPACLTWLGNAATARRPSPIGNTSSRISLTRCCNTSFKHTATDVHVCLSKRLTRSSSPMSSLAILTVAGLKLANISRAARTCLNRPLPTSTAPRIAWGTARALLSSPDTSDMSCETTFRLSKNAYT